MSNTKHFAAVGWKFLSKLRSLGQTRQFFKMSISKFDLDSKCLSKGSERPIFPEDGVLRLFSMRFCPYAQRAHLILEAKNIPYHTTNIHLGEKPEWYTQINSNGKVPALQLVNEPGSPFIVESLIITEYLDEKYPENQLYPSDPLAKAQAKLLIERFQTVQASFYVAATQPDNCGNALLELLDKLDVYEAELKSLGTPYFNGQRIGIVDYGLWPWFERFELLKVLHGDKFVYNEKRYPTLAAWTLLLLADEAVKRLHLSGEVHAEFLKTRNAGNPNFDLLIQ